MPAKQTFCNKHCGQAISGNGKLQACKEIGCKKSDLGWMRFSTLQVISMKLLPLNPAVKRVVAVLLLLTAASLIAWFSFRQGERHIAGPLAVRMANEGCFDCWAGLSVLKNTNQAKLALLLDRGMDYSAAMLAGMSLQHPELVQRTHYNLLIRVRDYRKKYGHDTQRSSDYDPAEVDRKVAEAIAHLESIHNTNQWGVPTLDEMIEHAEKSKGGR